MSGFIKKSEVIRHTILVINLYGIRVYIACLTARKGKTFLEIISKYGRI